MIEFLNANEGLISAIGVIMSIVIAILGFYINKNIVKISQNQSTGNKGKENQAGNDIKDESQNITDNSNHNTQIKK